MTPRIMRFDNISRLYGVPGIPSREEENAMVDAALEAFQGAREIEIRPSGAVVEIAMIWRRAPHYEDTMKEQREDFMRRIAGLPFRVILAGRSVIMKDPYDVSGTPDRVCILIIHMEYRKP